RSLVSHSWVTLSSTLLGFGFGMLLCILLAVLIVHNRAMDRSLMPWLVASQTIPILVIAPMIVSISYNVLTCDNAVAHLLNLDADASRLVSKA
ncbi:ABC transporter permease, partial [Rhizobium leguminosarum]